MLPCRSSASVRPSGDTAMAIDVPSSTTIALGSAGGGGAFEELLQAARSVSVQTPGRKRSERREPTMRNPCGPARSPSHGSRLAQSGRTLAHALHAVNTQAETNRDAWRKVCG